MSSRSLFGFLLFLAVTFGLSGSFFVSPAFAQSQPNLFLQKQSAIKNGSGLESWTNEAMSSNMMSLFTGMVGEIPAEIFESSTPTTNVIQNYIPGGAFGTMNNMVAALNTPPASGVEYIAQVRDSFLGKPAYAQGVGFNGLQFLLPLWRGFRNAVYVLTSIIFIAIGIMIMLRVKISPQAVVTVQSAIPQLITTLILVTFSYAIAGLVIDLFNFIQALVVALLFSVKGVPLTDSLFPGWWGSGFPIVSDILNGIGAIFTPENFKFSSLSNPTLRDMQMLTYRAVPGWLSLVMLGGLLGSIVLGFLLGGVGAIFGTGANFVGDMVGRVVGGAAGGLIGGLLVPIVLCIIVAIWLIKLYFGLLKCYVTLIFKIVLAPLEIGMGAFPNAKIGFSSWILDVAANMAVFPVVGIFLVLLNMIIDAVSVSNVGSTGGLFQPAVWTPSLLSAGGISPSIIGAAIGLAGLALISKLPEMVPQFIFMIKPSPWGQAIGEGLSKNMATSLGGAVASSVTGGIREEISDKTTDYVDKKVFMPFDSWRKKRQDQKGKDFQVKNPDVGDLD
ncbi:MAG: hypothetical protein US68_C0004G0023 [Candidatus Shapirobacteria bacterium GW2011_GWE1_38_10]|uniref:Uncharacterized protein n=1 Tax=Candidatus Shapirobacteria bacterium GW2011_GWE1_38_10 TaxID=1618488 RepID=A0A0G0LD18_9BACT|nr:MAG: hypothetical protein US46_C0005G0039 [Candidatus Shapirobacteria bacterium GW2011_GWF2_37_20]KKQ50541.1 MAG: hypothetical protein US68_C0004G0023 [Candidatus Shapirobacteria bacterium GW2011_GWE1_38_10]HBP51117.1 hypothetical protein [Candidatus Shapirobacteria bacterium]